MGNILKKLKCKTYGTDIIAKYYWIAYLIETISGLYFSLKFYNKYDILLGAVASDQTTMLFLMKWLCFGSKLSLLISVSVLVIKYISLYLAKRNTKFIVVPGIIGVSDVICFIYIINGIIKAFDTKILLPVAICYLLIVKFLLFYVTLLFIKSKKQEHKIGHDEDNQGKTIRGKTIRGRFYD